MATITLPPSIEFVRDVEFCPYSDACQYSRWCVYEKPLVRVLRAVEDVAVTATMRLVGMSCLLVGIALSLTLWLIPVGILMALVGMALMQSARPTG